MRHMKRKSYLTNEGSSSKTIGKCGEVGMKVDDLVGSGGVITPVSEGRLVIGDTKRRTVKDIGLGSVLNLELVSSIQSKDESGMETNMSK